MITLTKLDLAAMKVGKAVTIGTLRVKGGLAVIKRIEKDRWRVGEFMGDWIMRGTAEEVLARVS